MQKVLLITEKPNDTASELRIENYYDIEKNPFCQYFGRLIFGLEELSINYFNIENILWMHAKGSLAYGSIKNDGKEAIIKRVNNCNFKLVITFGKSAMNIFLPKFNMADLCSLNIDYPIIKKEIDGIISDRIKITNETGLCFFPHPSGQAQHLWIKNSVLLSNNLSKTQSIIMENL